MMAVVVAAAMANHRLTTNHLPTFLRVDMTQKQYLFPLKMLEGQKRANKACTRHWGVWRDSKHFSTPQHFSSWTASRRPPQRRAPRRKPLGANFKSAGAGNNKYELV
jgi:hypothetical protein